MRIAFYAPMKSPDHPVPSGDRLMARLLMTALRLPGHTVELASGFRSYSPSSMSALLVARAGNGAVEVERIRTQWQASGPPDLFFTYHPYYKAPDLLGPALCEAFGIRYVTAEASYSSRRDTGAWAPAQESVLAAVRQADLNICFTARDRDGLAPLVTPDRIAMLPPFIDPAGFSPRPVGKPPRLVTVAMMRAGDKLDSYTALAAALRCCLDLDWRLAVVGDGPSRADVQAQFGPDFDGRIEWLGERAPADIPDLLAGSDLYLWPGCGEAYGLAYLEAQAAGVPVVAMATAGVPEAVRDGATALLTPDGDLDAYAQAVRALLGDAPRRAAMGEQARRFVVEERSIDRAADQLDRLLSRLVA
jgi:glycosyltransferase involved in cell wall biosynthesis